MLHVEHGDVLVERDLEPRGRRGLEEIDDLAGVEIVGDGEAFEALGHEGITDVICLMGFYSSVSMTLAFYDVSAGATGMAR